MFISNYKEWEKIYEQKGELAGQSFVLSKDPKVKAVQKVVLEYLKIKFPYNDATEYLDRKNKIDAYIKTTDYDRELKDIILFFKNKGYKMPNDNINKFQNVLAVKNFLNTKGVTSDFKDGVFGVATLKAYMKYQSIVIGRVIKNKGNNYTYGDNVTASKEVDKLIKQGNVTAARKKNPIVISDKPKTTTQKIGIGTQSIK